MVPSTSASAPQSAPRTEQAAPQSAQVKAQSWSWRTLAITASLGLATGYLLNRFFPTTVGRSVFRYAISLVPAGVYMAGVALKNLTAPRAIRCSFQDPAERLRQERLGIAADSKLCKEYVAAWLQHPGKVEFSDEEIGRVYRQMKSSHSNDFIALMDCVRKNGWETQAIPGSNVYNSRQTEFGEPGQTEPFPIHAALYSEISDIPLETLGTNDVLLCMLAPKEGMPGIAHQVAVQRTSESEFTYYDPAFMQGSATGPQCKDFLLKSADIKAREPFLLVKITPAGKQ